jgi:hypothetical protein
VLFNNEEVGPNVTITALYQRLRNTPRRAGSGGSGGGEEDYGGESYSLTLVGKKGIRSLNLKSNMALTNKVNMDNVNNKSNAVIGHIEPFDNQDDFRQWISHWAPALFVCIENAHNVYSSDYFS